MDDDLYQIAATLADWSSDHPEMMIYFFGSRVRGDNRPDSDVDVVIDLPKLPSNDFVTWWFWVNQEDFASLNEMLPGRLQITERDTGLARAVVAAASEPKHRDRNVSCVWLPPKPDQSR